MRPDTKSLQIYVGGQMEFKPTEASYRFRGEITSIRIEDDELRIDCAWWAKSEGELGQLAGDWTNVEHSPMNYRGWPASLEVSNVGPGTKGSDQLVFVTLNDTVLLFPPDGDIVETSAIRGLYLSKA